MPKLKDRREVHLNNFMHGRLNRTEHRDLRGLVTKAHAGPLFRVKVPNIESYKRAIEYRGLPAYTRNLKNSSLFKSQQKRSLVVKAGR